MVFFGPANVTSLGLSMYLTYCCELRVFLAQLWESQKFSEIAFDLRPTWENWPSCGNRPIWKNRPSCVSYIISIYRSTVVAAFYLS